VELLILALSITPACRSLGPRTIETDRPAYTQTLAESWKSQMLLNMVRLRYADVPVFLDVASVINQYSFEGQVGINSPGWDRPSNVGPPIGSVSGRWADRPTISYNPLTGDAFARSLLTPIPPKTVMTLIQAGWPADFVFHIALRSINGLHNGSRSALFSRARDPEFTQLAEVLVAIQRSVGIGVRVKEKPDGEVVLITIERERGDELEAQRLRVGELLKLDPEASEYSLVFGGTQADSGQVAMMTRSMLEMIGEISTFIDVPEQHVAQGRLPAIAEPLEGRMPMHIHSGRSRPGDAYAAIEYRGYWYWIEDTDYRSKRLFTFMMIMLSLAETGSTPGSPLFTVSAGG